MSLDYYEVGAVLARGTFSTITLTKERGTGRIFALKSVERSHYLNHKTEYLLEAESEIRSQNASQWIVGLQNYWEDGKRSYFVMEYLPGGTFAGLLESNGGRLTGSTAMFYLGELVLAINAVHCVGFAHRNIKPEHILLDGLGHLKISGFGSSSKISSGEDGGTLGKVTSPITVDSASYEAPEILRTLGNTFFTYGVECDYWSLGVIAYETLVGGHPFAASSPLSAFKKITTKKTKGAIKIPASAKLSLEAKNFITSLLLEAEERLTYPDCISHPFFNDLIWDGLRNEVAPLKPGEIHKREIEELGGRVGDENDYKTHDFTNYICEDVEDVNVGVGDEAGITGQEIKDVTFVFPTQTVMQSLAEARSMRKSGYSGLDPVPEGKEESSSSWSVAEVMERLEKSKNKSNSILSVPLSPRKTEEEKLRSELEIKTVQLMDKLHEIQILQTQLQKCSDDLESREKQNTALTKENQRLKVEMEHLSGQYSNEKSAREGLEHKLDKVFQMNCSVSMARPSVLIHDDSDEAESEELVELKDRVAQLQESDSQKDDMIQDLSVRVKILQHELLVQELENKIMFRRDEGTISIFQDAYKQTIEELRQRLKEIEKIAGDKRGAGEFEVESKIRKMMDGKGQELTVLEKKIEELRCSHEKNLRCNVRAWREIAEVLGSIAVKMDRVFQEYNI